MTTLQSKALHVQRQSAYRQRKKTGVKPLPSPWAWMTIAEAKEIALQAFRVASWHMREDVAEGRLSDQDLREAFADSLAEMFKHAISAHAVSNGGCWPVDDQTPSYADHLQIWRNLSAEVPDTWRPQYPLYEQQGGQQ